MSKASGLLRYHLKRKDILFEKPKMDISLLVLRGIIGNVLSNKGFSRC